jgi:3-deoxy-D-manno-octulosonic-acid transferase
MLWLYNIAIILYRFVLSFASIFNNKAKLFRKGRKNIFLTINKQIDSSKKHIWFHFASLGEFEQGRPVLEALKKIYPEKGIVVTFFSPSGYEIRKNYALAEGVFYLPIDTKYNAAEFVRLINPEIAVFTKYEFWYHYFKTLHKRQIPLLLISGIFRPDQVFFKWYGGFYRRILSNVSHFFVQNEESVELLKSINLENVSLSGDTRFDRVTENAETPKDLPLIARFSDGSKVFIAGSTWLPDEKIITSSILDTTDWKFIIAPHEIDENHILQLMELVPGAFRYSEAGKGTIPDNIRVVVIDNIGMLSSIYRYADLAYIGGGFGTGIHNTLEAAAFGIPLIFGPRYQKFQEAKDLIKLGAAISIQNENDLSTAFEILQKDQTAGLKARQYVSDKKGSTAQILKFIGNILGSMLV